MIRVWRQHSQRHPMSFIFLQAEVGSSATGPASTASFWQLETPFGQLIQRIGAGAGKLHSTSGCIWADPSAFFPIRALKAGITNRNGLRRRNEAGLCELKPCGAVGQFGFLGSPHSRS